MWVWGLLVGLFKGAMALLGRTPSTAERLGQADQKNQQVEADDDALRKALAVPDPPAGSLRDPSPDSRD